jgi:hypothetical protein
VELLFVALGRQCWGAFSPKNGEIVIHPNKEHGDEDLLNCASIQTILNGGFVYAVDKDEVPSGSPAAALFRY